VDVTLGGESLVKGTAPTGFSTVTVSGATDVADAASSPVTLSVGGKPVSLDAGEMGGQVQVLDHDLPDYGAKLDGFVQDLVQQVNDGQAAGKDLAGNAGTDFFSGTTAADLQVSITDPTKIAAADKDLGSLDGSNADTMAGLDMGGSSYRNLITTFGVSVASASQVSTNQDLLTAQVDAAQESVSGISIDEEMVNLLTAQRGYEGASRVMTTLDSVLDTLINHTGVTH
jgi:flagellar hook-associated protein 1 FlgK